MSGFSSALKLTDLNDFIQPSQVCVKPVESGEAKTEVSKPSTAEDASGGDTQIVINKSKSWKARSAKNSAGDASLETPKPSPTPLSVTLGDCLACSGCITSAEAVLVAEQSHTKVFELLEKRIEGQIFVLSMSLQSIASLAVKSRLSMQTAAEKLASFFRSLGVDYVLDIALARHVCLLESARELEEKFTLRKDEDTVRKNDPILSSTCPGFVCYAEKSQGPILVPALSRVKSPQQIMGQLVKRRFECIQSESSARFGAAGKPTSICHITLMPCYDKKLEASRNDNRITVGEDDEPEVDCVITPIEVEQMLEMRGLAGLLDTLPTTKLDTFGTDFDADSLIKSHHGSGAGGYAENLFLYAAVERLSSLKRQQSVDNNNKTPLKLHWKQVRNADYLELKLYESGTTDPESVGQRELLSFAILNGFRNIQNLVSKFKRKTANYDYIEVSACPKGCLNGGAQIRDVPFDETVNSSKNSEPWQIAFEQTNSAYQALPKTEFTLEFADCPLEQNLKLYKHLRIDEEFRASLRTQFHIIERSFNILNSNW